MTKLPGFSPLVSAQWLEHHLDQVVVLDGSYYLSSMGKNAEREFADRRIAGAQRWDIDEIADKSSGLKHMMPGAEAIARAAGERGISNQSTVVVYDQLGMFSAARVWLALKRAGHPPAALLDGGLPAWSGPVESGPVTPAAETQYGSFQSTETTVDRKTVARELADETACVVDARSAGRFSGAAPEPVQGLRSGHMPGSINLPFTELLTQDNRFKSVDELKQVFADAGIDLARPIITSCGSGVTASIVSFALALLGSSSLVYDGSWSEWGQPDLKMPITC